MPTASGRPTWFFLSYSFCDFHGPSATYSIQLSFIQSFSFSFWNNHFTLGQNYLLFLNENASLSLTPGSSGVRPGAGGLMAERPGA